MISKFVWKFIHTCAVLVVPLYPVPACDVVSCICIPCAKIESMWLMQPSAISWGTFAQGRYQAAAAIMRQVLCYRQANPSLY